MTSKEQIICICYFNNQKINGGVVIPQNDLVKKIAKSIHDKIVNTNAQASCLELAESVVNDLLEKGETK